MPAIPLSRRELLRQALLGGALVAWQPSHGVASKLNPADPVASKLGYVEDARRVDSRHFPNYKSGQTCANCALVRLQYGFWRPCKLFPNNLVNAKGWCNGWAPVLHQ